MALVVKISPANAGDIRHVSSVPGSGRSPGGGHGNPLQYSCLENPMERGAWWATAHRVPKTRIQLKQLSIHTERVREDTEREREVERENSRNLHRNSSKSC